MINIGKYIVAMWTDPGEDMLLGFSLQKNEMYDLESNEPLGSMNVFSIGGFFFRIDTYFNIKGKDEIN